jgi:serine/threonine protein kinase/tetratricopeptide (TPR) repeat protein
MPFLSLGSAQPAGRSLPSEAADQVGAGTPEGDWISQQVDAMAEAWARGEPVNAEAILAENPGIGDEAAIRLIYEELCLRRESGEDVPTTEFVARFPRWKDELGVLIGCDRLLRPLTRIATLPEVGEDLGPFRLLAELGRGASGKTYLAAEPGLADRLVVLKVISDDQEEHLSLARLQHTHIIPLFSEHTFPDRGLRALCMPYLGGTSLARILEVLAQVPLANRRGHHILEVLDREEGGRPEPMQPDGPYRRYLEKASYVEAICWIGACLADALQDAHARGLVHMDVKPSNVLIAADGHPMLLDFHLASKPIQAGERFPDRIGGTPGWMAPEHAAAMEAVSQGQPIPGPVDHRADLYALGLLLRMALGGAPVAGRKDEDRPSLRRRNPEVSIGLEDVIRKCLTARPSGRYPLAAALADDLRRHVENQPLRGVPNRSLAERWRKRRRRNPATHLGATGLVLLVVIAVLAVWFLLFSYPQRVQEIQTDLKDGHEFCERGLYDNAVHSLRRGLERAATFPPVARLTRALDAELRVALRKWDAAKLHHLAELIRFDYGIDPPEGGKATALLRDIRVIWERRSLLFPPGARELDAELDHQVRTDLLELVAVWAEVRTRRASPDESIIARDEALALLDDARASCGPSFAIDHMRRSIANEPGAENRSIESDPVPHSASEHYDLGRSYLRSEQFAKAAAEFRTSLDQRPQDFWPNFYAGLCAYHLKAYQDAFAAFSICIALDPSSPHSYFNRALAAESIERPEQALRDYRHVWELDNRFTDALLNRGLLSYNLGHYSEAIADFRQALGSSSDSHTQGRVHYHLARAYMARGDRSLALASAEKAVANGVNHARILRDQLLGDR